MFRKSNEDYFIKWLDFKEGYGTGVTGYHDESLPPSFHKPKKKLTSPEKYQKSKRFIFFRELKAKKKICDICGSSKNLVIDHCHNSRKIRGVICDLCNKGLGNFKDDISLIKKAIGYLKQARENEKEALDYYTLKVG